MYLNFHLLNNTSSSPRSSKYNEGHIVTVSPRSRIILESRITMKGQMPFPQRLACSKHWFRLLSQQVERVGIISPQRRQRADTCGEYRYRANLRKYKSIFWGGRGVSELSSIFLINSSAHLWRFVARCTAKVSRNCYDIVNIIGQICQLEGYHRRIPRNSVEKKEGQISKHTSSRVLKRPIQIYIPLKLVYHSIKK